MNRQLYFAKRAALGILTMLGILIVGEFLPRPPYEPLDTKAFLLIDPSRELWMALGAAVTAFAGAYVARVRFTAVAVLFNTVLFLIIVKILYSISAPVQGSPAVLTEIVGRNSAGFLVSTLAVIIGAEIGQWLVQKTRGSASHAA